MGLLSMLNPRTFPMESFVYDSGRTMVSGEYGSLKGHQAPAVKSATKALIAVLTLVYNQITL
jgi:hypothetical protein